MIFWTLVNRLFPSPAGKLAVETSLDNYIGRFATTKTVAYFLNLAYQTRMHVTNGEKDDEIKALLRIDQYSFLDDITKSLEKDAKITKQLQKNIVEIYNCIVKSIEEEKEDTKEKKLAFILHFRQNK